MDDKETAAELAAQAEVKEDEVRASVIAEYGFDEVDDAERIEKLVKKEVESRTKLSQAIGQKIKYRTELEKAKTTSEQKPEEKKSPEDVSKLVAEQLEKRDLDDLSYPDDIKKNIQRVAQTQGISIKQAARDPWIVSQIEAHKKAEEAEEATISRTNRSKGSKQFSIENPPEVDMTTEEGRKTWDEWKKWASTKM